MDFFSALRSARCYDIGNLSFDVEQSCLRNKETGAKTMLTVKETQILALLAENENNIVRREVILSHCWGKDGKDYFTSRSLDVFVNKLRKCLENEPGVELKTVRGVGLDLTVGSRKFEV